MRHKKSIEDYRREIRCDLDKVVVIARMNFVGDTSRDSRMLHRHICNYHRSVRIEPDYLIRCIRIYVRDGVMYDDVLYEMCQDYVHRLCVNTDGSDDDLYSLSYETAKKIEMEGLKRRIRRCSHDYNHQLHDMSHEELKQLAERLEKQKAEEEEAEKKRRQEKEQAALEAKQRMMSPTICHIDKGTVVIKENEYSCRHNVSSFILPNSVRIIEDAAFSQSMFTTIDLPEGLESIGSWAFSWCLRMKKIVLPQSLKHMGHNPFAVTNITDVKSLSPFFAVHDNAIIDTRTHTLISYIGKDDLPDRALQDDNASNEVHYYIVPADVTALGRDCFRGRSLRTLVISSQVDTLLGNPIADSTIENIINFSPHFRMDDSLLLSADGKTLYAIHGEGDELVIPEGVTTIIEEALLLCQYTTVRMPSTIESYTAECFRGSDKLKHLMLPRAAHDRYAAMAEEYADKVEWID